MVHREFGREAILLKMRVSMAKLYFFGGITYLVGKIKFKLLFQGPLAK